MSHTTPAIFSTLNQAGAHSLPLWPAVGALLKLFYKKCVGLLYLPSAPSIDKQKGLATQDYIYIPIYILSVCTHMSKILRGKSTVCM